MQPFTTLSGPAAPLLIANVDTDVIIRIERLTAGDRSILGHYAFEALRYDADGAENPGFVLNQPRFKGAPVLIVGPNFGCGSSREGAVWALLGCGIRCVIGDSFGDIFFSNCFQNGVLPIRLPVQQVEQLAEAASNGAPAEINLFEQTVTVGNTRHAFTIDSRRRESLLHGLDDLGLSLKRMEAIRQWQSRDRARRPWIWLGEQTT